MSVVLSQRALSTGPAARTRLQCCVHCAYVHCVTVRARLELSKAQGRVQVMLFYAYGVPNHAW
jgi:hypothetical protein